MPKNIKSRFEEESKKQPVGGYIAFVGAIRDQKFTRYAISRNMNNLLVLGEDYQEEDRKELLEQLYQLSNNPEEAKIEGKFLNVGQLIIKSIVSDVCIKI